MTELDAIGIRWKPGYAVNWTNQPQRPKEKQTC